MKSILKTSVLLILIGTISYAGGGIRQHNLLPVPSDIEFGEGWYVIDNDFKIEIPDTAGMRCPAAATRFLHRLAGRTGIFFEQGFVSAGDKKSTAVTIECARTGRLVVGEDESYTLTVTTDRISLVAETDLGVLHGLETLLQLFDSDGTNYYFQEATINDVPRFPWRGLMIDVCRHFQPVEVIKRNIDAMAAVKLNVLHLHLSEDQGFRVESKIYPRLQQYGSDGDYFSQEQLRELVAYAGRRGVRVVPEFDMPAHTTAWFPGYPQLSSRDTVYAIERHWGVMDPVMDPTRESTYEFLDQFIGEMAAVFPDEYFHIGGDENNGVHWGANQAIQDYMQANGYQTVHELQSYFIDRVRQIVNKHGKKMIGWDEIYDPEMDREIITQFWSWNGLKQLQPALEQGFRGIISNGYYIDLFWSAEQHYLKDLLRAGFITDPEFSANILGGEVTAWSEFMTPELIDGRLWPRTAAVAERFWSLATVTDVDDLYRRLENVSFRLEEVGLQHIKNYSMQLRRLTGNRVSAQLKLLADLVEPVDGYQRHRFDSSRVYTSYAPLTRLVDVVQADAFAARRFRSLTADYLQEYTAIVANSADLRGRKRVAAFKKLGQGPAGIELAQVLRMYLDNHSALEEVITANPILQEIRPLSADLSAVAAAGLWALEYLQTGKTAPADHTAEQLELLERALPPRAELELRIVPAVIDLVRAAGNLPPADKETTSP
ncbi:MAG: beta-N-acetylhexosaminidase [Candidatus Neomarinimicrobiota bacterium]